MRYCFGIDIGGTTVKMGLFHFDGTLVEKWEVETRKENHGENILPDVAASIQKKMEEQNLDKEDVLGIGVGIPAPVTEAGVVQATANLGWGYKEVKHELETLVGMTVKVGNDANVAALGEMWKGGGLGHKNMIMVTLGTGVGGGIISNGHMVVGGHGAGGEIGHICVNYDETEVCGCGNRGCLEQYASATGIVYETKKALKDFKEATTLRDLDEVTAKDIFDAAKEGDTFAKERVDDLGQKLALAAGNIALMVDPEVFVIGGGVSRAGQILLDAVNAHFKKYTFGKAQETGFVLATLGNDAGIYGAASLMLS